MSKKPAASALSPEYVLLGFLNQQADHGYDLHERMTRELGQIWHISLSQTYNILKRLEARGYIAGMMQEQEKSPARRHFRLTPSGRARFLRWLNVPTELSSRAIRVEFLTRLYFVYQATPEAAARLIEMQTAETRAGLERLQLLLDELPQEQTFNRLGLELRIRQMASVLSWLADCQTQLNR